MNESTLNFISNRILDADMRYRQAIESDMDILADIFYRYLNDLRDELRRYELKLLEPFETDPCECGELCCLMGETCSPCREAYN